MREIPGSVGGQRFAVRDEYEYELYIQISNGTWVMDLTTLIPVIRRCHGATLTFCLRTIGLDGVR